MEKRKDKVVYGLGLGDLHFGHPNTARMRNELEIVFKTIEERPVDIIIIKGDYFDKKLAATDKNLEYAIEFFSRLVSVAKSKNIKVRFIKGTNTHDHNQIDTVFGHYVKDPEFDFKIFNEVSEEETLGMKFLYIPEEYPNNPAEYYAEYKKKQYNNISGHGTFDFVAFPDQVEMNEELEISSAPVFIFDEWKSCVQNGFIDFSHIHGRNTLGNKVFYPGSFSRWGFGEKSKKGFTFWEFNLETKKYKVEFIDNDEALTYESIIVKDIIGDSTEDDIVKIIETLDTVRKQYDHTRLILKGLDPKLSELISNNYKKSAKDSVKILNENVNLKPKTKNTKYDYIVKNELPMIQRLQRFVKEEYNVDISVELIGKLIIEDENKA